MLSGKSSSVECPVGILAAQDLDLILPGRNDVAGIQGGRSAHRRSSEPRCNHGPFSWADIAPQHGIRPGVAIISSSGLDTGLEQQALTSVVLVVPGIVHQRDPDRYVILF